MALKISFANTIAKLSDKVGADIVEVMDAVGQDKRIGKAFLNAGRGYGGGCFPKDVSGLIDSMHEHGTDSSILDAAQSLNKTMPEYIVTKVENEIGSISNKKVAVLGLAFKSGTSDARKSPAAKVATILSEKGASVKAYDPEANEEAEEELPGSVVLCSSASEATTDAEIVFVATDWPEFKDMDLAKLAQGMSGKIFVDCMNVFNKDAVLAAGLEYTGVGRE